MWGARQPGREGPQRPQRCGCWQPPQPPAECVGVTEARVARTRAPGGLRASVAGAIGLVVPKDACGGRRTKSLRGSPCVHVPCGPYLHRSHCVHVRIAIYTLRLHYHRIAQARQLREQTASGASSRGSAQDTEDDGDNSAWSNAVLGARSLLQDAFDEARQRRSDAPGAEPHLSASSAPHHSPVGEALGVSSSHDAQTSTPGRVAIAVGHRNAEHNASGAQSAVHTHTTTHTEQADAREPASGAAAHVETGAPSVVAVTNQPQTPLPKSSAQQLQHAPTPRHRRDDGAASSVSAPQRKQNTTAVSSHDAQHAVPASASVSSTLAAQRGRRDQPSSTGALHPHAAQVDGESSGGVCAVLQRDEHVPSARNSVLRPPESSTTTSSAAHQSAGVTDATATGLLSPGHAPRAHTPTLTNARQAEPNTGSGGSALDASDPESPPLLEHHVHTHAPSNRQGVPAMAGVVTAVMMTMQQDTHTEAPGRSLDTRNYTVDTAHADQSTQSAAPETTTGHSGPSTAVTESTVDHSHGGLTGTAGVVDDGGETRGRASSWDGETVPLAYHCDALAALRKCASEGSIQRRMVQVSGFSCFLLQKDPLFDKGCTQQRLPNLPGV